MAFRSGRRFTVESQDHHGRNDPNSMSDQAVNKQAAGKKFAVDGPPLIVSVNEEHMTRQGRVWCWYTILWGSVSLVLWAGHYPPA